MVKYDEVSNIFAIKEQVETEDLFQHMRPSADDFKLFCEQLHQSEEQETKPKKVLSCRSLKAIPTDTRQRLYNWICQHPLPVCIKAADLYWICLHC
ncbi:hypothetical protein F7725_006156 [Dissostichus mawsoni]|uniref:Uncharacterized protein n=1 Tax=Dissostichus mawsoni TaxID=36200 RepID=A0A7J5YVE5_DISMA|nr:hypothetical protein F7725_006156 [Dissostichus mawsoni]